MNRDGYSNATMFVGTEVEHSPAFGMRTLFVIGLQDPDLIQATALAHRCEHIYFGANQSFPNLKFDSEQWQPWEKLISRFLQANYWCTLDLSVQCTNGLLESGLIEHYRFIPMISVKLPYIQLLGYNATIKLDDQDFESTNPGVWCHSLHDLMNKNVFTDWSKYTKDTIVNEPTTT